MYAGLGEVGIDTPEQYTVLVYQWRSRFVTKELTVNVGTPRRVTMVAYLVLKK